jgi:hypothetical protein
VTPMLLGSSESCPQSVLRGDKTDLDQISDAKETEELKLRGGPFDKKFFSLFTAELEKCI